MILRDYQEDILRRIEQAERDGDTEQLVAAATGLGKTVIFAELAKRRAALGRVVIIVHRSELVSQTVDKLRDLGLQVGIVKGAADEVSADVVVASVQTLAMGGRVDRLRGLAAANSGQLDLDQAGPHIATVIVDECHHVAEGNSWAGALDALGCGQPGGPLLVGFTATPWRGDGQPLQVFQRIVADLNLRWGIASKWLCDIRAKELEVPGFDMRRVTVSRGDYAASSAGEELVRCGAAEVVVDGWKQHANDGQTIAFVPTVGVAHLLAQTFRGAGVPSVAIDGSTPEQDRAQVIEDYRRGRIRVLVNCMVLTEGFDAPETACILLARPTKSSGLLTQMVGRGTRPHPNKDHLRVLDFVAAVRGNDVVNVPGMFGVRDPDLLRRAASGAVGMGEAIAGQIEVDRVEGIAAAADVELLRERTNSKPVAWVRGQAKPGAPVVFVRPIEGELWALVDDTRGGWSAVCIRGKDRPEVVASGVDLAVAQGVAEQAIRAQMGTLLDAAAKWRADRPTAKQRDLAAKLNVSAEGNKGEVSDRITAALNTAKIRAAVAALSTLAG